MRVHFVTVWVSRSGVQYGHDNQGKTWRWDPVEFTDEHGRESVRYEWVECPRYHHPSRAAAPMPQMKPKDESEPAPSREGPEKPSDRPLPCMDFITRQRWFCQCKACKVAEAWEAEWLANVASEAGEE